MQDARSCVIYARKSTDREDKQILSIPSQLATLREHAARNGLRIDCELTEARSAREPGRPVFGALLADAAAGRVGTILCWRLDRLARNPVDGGQLIHLLGKARIREIMTTEGRYTGTGDQKFMLAVQFGAATKYTDDLSAGVKRGNGELVKTGRIPGAPPVGYMKIRPHRGLKGAGAVVPDPERFELVRSIWQRALTGSYSVAELWRLATKWGLTSQPSGTTGGGPIRPGHVYTLLRNSFYAGTIRHAGATYPGEHTPMVTAAQFERVQRLVSRRDMHRPSRHHFLYRGLLTCGHCGRLLVGERITNRQGHVYTYYRCGRRQQGYLACQAPAPTEADITADIAGQLGRLTLPERLVTWCLAAIDTWAESERTTAQGGRHATGLQLRRLERKLDGFIDMAAEGKLDMDTFDRKKAEVQAEIEATKSRLVDPAVAIDAWRTAFEQAFALGPKVATAFRVGPDERRRDLLAEIGENLTVTAKKTALALKFPFGVLLTPAMIAATEKPCGENLQRASDSLLNLAKNAPPAMPQLSASFPW